jgi:hypothetical protein
MTFVNYPDELGRVVGQVMPLMEQAGSRCPFAPTPPTSRDSTAPLITNIKPSG